MPLSTVRRPRGKNTAQRLQEMIATSKGEVVLRRDLKSHASPSQPSRALRQLMEEGKLVRVGGGVYAKARLSPLSRRPVPRQTLAVLAAEIFDRLGIAWELDEAQRLYHDGLITQFPGGQRSTRDIAVLAAACRWVSRW